MTQFGIYQSRLPPGSWSSQWHWHTGSDEFVYVLSGEVALVTDEGDEILRAGDAAGFKAGDENGHHLQNRSNVDAVVLEIGTRTEDDAAFYPGIDLVHPAGDKPAMYTHRDGKPRNIRHRTPGGLLRPSYSCSRPDLDLQAARGHLYPAGLNPWFHLVIAIPGGAAPEQS